MDNATPPTSWVERAIVQVKDTATYERNVREGGADYETLPVPAWNAQRNWVVIGVGDLLRSGPGPHGVTGARPPRIACVVDWPQATLHWVEGDALKNAWPTRPGLPALAIPAQVPGKHWDHVVAYHRALSAALERGAFSAKPPADPPAACAAARAARDAFAAAAVEKNLAPVYAAPLHDIDGWIASHCAKP